ncbi:uncharacterized protein C12orf71 homolog [Choloepus didactylus]|uniref:uncharacterized protein C12orf71 homolog n=1 Tax=Choloepus didactylus TaxID=27675 RepID=UPI00189E77FB|nr:uncharacterized protein C12orf71 homolog [Choloepus didactylus]
MAYSSSNSDSTDIENCSSESNLSLSVGYFPCEDTLFYEDTAPCEDKPSEGISDSFFPPIQRTWRTENIGRPMGRRDQIQDNPQQFCKLSIALAWDVDVDSNNSDSIANWDLNGDNQWMDKYLDTKTHLTLSKLDGLVQKLEEFLENQNDDEDDDSVSHESAQEEDLQPSSSSPPDMGKMISQRTSTTDISSNSSSQPVREDSPSNVRALSCLNFGWVFRWLWQQVFSSLLGREHPERATESPHQLAEKKRLSRRSKRIQPQEPLELGHPVSPEFLTI